MSGTEVVLLLLLMKPFVLLTAIETEAVPPGDTGKVLAVDDKEKVSAVAVTVRLTVVLTLAGLVGVTVTICAPVGNAMFGSVAMVSVVVTGFVPSKVTAFGLKLQLAPVGRPVQLLGLKFTTAGVELAIGVIVMVELTDFPAETETEFKFAVSAKSGFRVACQASARLSASTEPRPVTRS